MQHCPQSSHWLTMALVIQVPKEILFPTGHCGFKEGGICITHTMSASSSLFARDSIMQFHGKLPSLHLWKVLKKKDNQAFSILFNIVIHFWNLNWHLILMVLFSFHTHLALTDTELSLHQQTKFRTGSIKAVHAWVSFTVASSFQIIKTFTPHKAKRSKAINKWKSKTNSVVWLDCQSLTYFGMLPPKQSRNWLKQWKESWVIARCFPVA